MSELSYPLGKFRWPESINASERGSFIETIAAAPARLRAAIANLDDAQLDTPYRPGGWTVRQTIHHVADSHMNSYLRMKFAVTEKDPLIKAYAEAGADCLYAPGITKREQIEAVVKAVAPKPVNFLNSGALGFTVSDLAAMGVRRISVGGSLARVAMHAFIRTATEIAKDGKFDGFAGLISNPELNKFFSEDRKKLSS